MMNTKICSAFLSCKSNNCLEKVSNSEFKIADDELTNKSKIVNLDGALTVRNNQEKLLNFLKIDSCIFDESDSKRCDCALYDEKKFFFVEFKTYNKNQNRTHKRRAIKQLENTIDTFLEKGIEFSDYELKALICFNFIPTRPVASTRMQQKKKEFWDNYKADLLEGNEIIFD